MRFVLFFEGTNNSQANPSLMHDLYSMPCLSKPGVMAHIVNGSGVHGGIVSMLTGRDSAMIVLEQYKWLTDSIYKCGGCIKESEIYVFGFSRGAYQACRFVEMLSLLGIPNTVGDCETYLNLYKKHLAGIKVDTRDKTIPLIRYLGIVDAVKSTFCDGFPNREVKLPDIDCRHAIAIHETRCLFEPLYLAGIIGKCNEQFFMGVHSDLGRGYRDSNSTWYKKVCRGVTILVFILKCFMRGVRPKGTSFSVSLADTKTFSHIVASWITQKVPFMSVPPLPNSATQIICMANNLPLILRTSRYEPSNLFGLLRRTNRRVSHGQLHSSVRMCFNVYFAFRNIYPMSYRRNLISHRWSKTRRRNPVNVNFDLRDSVVQKTEVSSTFWSFDSFLRSRGYVGGANNPFD